jgi:hypothetical protein
VLFQGNHKDEREAVVPGFLSVLDPNPAKLAKPVNKKTTGRRLTLAKWIVAPTNPFTARVLVNRVWQGYFGVGLVETANDFGLAGNKPTHPELLDHLATELVKNNWSLKQLHRLIVSSAAYRQRVVWEEPAPMIALASSRVGRRNPTILKSTVAAPGLVDAGNSLLWRQNLRRLSAEQLRDSLLSVSGQLLQQGGGPPIWPELPKEVLQANPAFLDDNAEKTKGWYPSPVEKRNVRSIYLVQKRTVRIPFMETFDLPENSTSCPRRNQSIVPPQALSLLNGSDAIAAAEALAREVEKRSGQAPQDKVVTAFQLALQRSPTSDELSQSIAFLQQRSLKELCRVLLNLNEFLFVD